jgi:hypothetical protein
MVIFGNIHIEKIYLSDYLSKQWRIKLAFIESRIVSLEDQQNSS